MDTLLRSLTRAFARVDRAVRWSLSTVEEEPRPAVVPMPGPAHGPVPSITLRLEEQGVVRPRS
jgi:hypothetical protein